MKGMSFQKPLEFRLQVEGETWNQGDSISGVLEVKNRGSESISLADMQVQLGHGRLKRVHEKMSGAFKILEKTGMDASATLAPNAEAKLQWKFPTDRNCPITDSMASLFLLYGKGEVVETLGQLQ